MLKAGMVRGIFYILILFATTSAFAVADKPPPDILTDALIADHNSDPIVLIPGILGSRFIKENEKGEKRITYAKLLPLVGQNYRELLLKTQVQIGAPKGSVAQWSQERDDAFDVRLHNEIMVQLGRNETIYQEDSIDRVVETNIIDRVGLNDSPYSADFSDRLQKSVWRREVPGLGSTEKSNHDLIRSGVPFLQELGYLGEWLASWPVLDLALDGGLIAGLDMMIRPGISAYENILRHLRTMGYTKEKKRLYVFSYDWRQNNFYSALQLKNFIENHPELKGRKVHIVAHSMGSTVTKLYVNAFEGYKHVRSVSLFAPPLRGSSIAFWLLFEGQRHMAQLFGKENAKEIMFWSPSLWQLLPRDDRSLWSQAGLPIPDTSRAGEIYNQFWKPLIIKISEKKREGKDHTLLRLQFAKLMLHLNDAVHRVLTDDREYICGVAELRHGWKDYERQERCDSLTRELDRIQYLHVVSKNTPDAMTLNRVKLDISHVNDLKIVDHVYNNQGDGTVPFHSTLTKPFFDRVRMWNLSFVINNWKQRYEFVPEKNRPPTPDAFKIDESNPIQDLFRTPLDFLSGKSFGALDYISAHTFEGLRLSKNLMMKQIPGADHMSVLTHIDSLRALRLFIRAQMLESHHGFEAINVESPEVGAVKLLWRTYGNQSVQCRESLRFALNSQLNELINPLISAPPVAPLGSIPSREEEIGGAVAYLNALEGLSRASVLSFYCQRAPKKKDRIGFFYHDIKGKSYFVAGADLEKGIGKQDLRPLLKEGLAMLIKKARSAGPLWIPITSGYESKSKPMTFSIP